jgi:hypothetical protein
MKTVTLGHGMNSKIGTAIKRISNINLGEDYHISTEKFDRKPSYKQQLSSPRKYLPSDDPVTL